MGNRENHSGRCTVSSDWHGEARSHLDQWRPYNQRHRPIAKACKSNASIDVRNGHTDTDLQKLPLHNELRMKYEYNNIMYTAVAHAVECTLDQPYKILLKEHIFDPLRMHNTVYTVVDAVTMAEQDANITFADGFWWNSTSQEFEQVPLSDIAPSKGSGGMISNVLDYSRWVRHLMQPTDLNPALSHNTVKEMRTPRTVIEPSKLKPYVGPQAYGLGLYCQVYRDREIIQHAGASPGHMSLMMTVPPNPTEDPNSGWAVVIMQNTWSLAMDIVAWYLLDRFLGTPKDERHDMAGAARKAQEEKSSMLESENVISRLYGFLKLDRSIQPSLPLDRLNGTYRHIAYHEFKVSETRLPGRNDSEVILLLQPSGLRKTYYSLTATLHHVSGEYWWAHRRIGPGNWLTDEALKVFFVVGSDGVQGMKFQAEPSMPDHLLFFEKVA